MNLGKCWNASCARRAAEAGNAERRNEPGGAFTFRELLVWRLIMHVCFAFVRPYYLQQEVGHRT